jgi:K(+)-stimulated pyrophosphate-energized sodium pump
LNAAPQAPGGEGVTLEFLRHLGSQEWLLLWLVLLSGLTALAYGLWLRAGVLRRDTGSDAMREVAAAIQAGSLAYLKRQFQTLIVFIFGLAVLLYFVYLPIYDDQRLALGVSFAFLAGSLSSYAAGFIGMMLAVQGNVRVAAAALTSFKSALQIAFRSGAVAGMMTVGLGLTGSILIFMIFRADAMKVLVGYGFGCALVALFMRVGGGIFTKAADVGADLVGKVEADIPEDDPRNAATIADNVGDNVGDCAGMAADVFESYIVTLIASVILGVGVLYDNGLVARLGGRAGADALALHLVIYPMLVNAVGIFASILGISTLSGRDDAEMDAMRPIQNGFRLAALAAVVGFGLISYFFLSGLGVDWWKFFLATLMGVVLAVVIERLTDHFTSTEYSPVTEIALASRGGPATLLLSGLSTGLEAAVWQALAIAATVAVSFAIFQSAALAAYGVALTGLGLLTTAGFILAMDTFGPISDNANGIFEMSGALQNEGGEKDETAQRIVSRLDAVGNTTKALTKGFAIATAVIAALSLFSSYIGSVAEAQLAQGLDAALRLNATGIQINLTNVFIGFIIGGCVPFLFSSFAIRAVSRSAGQVVNEVRRQFRDHPGIMTGDEKPDYARCVDIVTAAAQKELLAPAVLAICTPIAVAFAPGLGAAALGGYLAGAILCGQLMAVFMSTAGGAWDNAKKKIEDGMLGGKGTEFHKASIIGDTVGDPFKDTAGPALNPLIKVMNLVAILVAPLTIAPLAIGTRIGITSAMLLLLAVAVTMNKRSENEEAVEAAVAVREVEVV